jgi:hypothetical protein
MASAIAVQIKDNDTFKALVTSAISDLGLMKEADISALIDSKVSSEAIRADSRIATLATKEDLSAAVASDISRKTAAEISYAASNAKYGIYLCTDDDPAISGISSGGIYEVSKSGVSIIYPITDSESFSIESLTIGGKADLPGYFLGDDPAASDISTTAEYRISDRQNVASVSLWFDRGDKGSATNPTLIARSLQSGGAITIPWKDILTVPGEIRIFLKAVGLAKDGGAAIEKRKYISGMVRQRKAFFLSSDFSVSSQSQLPAGSITEWAESGETEYADISETVLSGSEKYAWVLIPRLGGESFMSVTDRIGGNSIPFYLYGKTAEAGSEGHYAKLQLGESEVEYATYRSIRKLAPGRYSLRAEIGRGN